MIDMVGNDRGKDADSRSKDLLSWACRSSLSQCASDEGKRDVE